MRIVGSLRCASCTTERSLPGTPHLTLRNIYNRTLKSLLVYSRVTTNDAKEAIARRYSAEGASTMQITTVWLYQPSTFCATCKSRKFLSHRCRYDLMKPVLEDTGR